MSEDVGRPTELNEELLLKIKGYILNNNNLKDISEIIEVPYKTMESWSTRNYQGFADKLLSYKHERMLLKAESNLETLLGADDDNVRLKAAIHVSETLGKKHYSKRNELTGSDGKDLPTPIINVQRNDSVQEDKQS